MRFGLTEEQKSFRSVANAFAKDHWQEPACQWDIQHHFPQEALREAAKLGFAAMYVKSHFGGSELKRLDAAIVLEQLASSCVSTAAFLSIHNMVGWLLDCYGAEPLKKRFLPSLASMEIFSSYCLTEPHAGSDAASLKTTAQKKGSNYVINGSKAFISGGGMSDIYVVMARTGEIGPKGISCFLVEKDTKGLSFGENEKKLGWHSQPTAMLFFEDCTVPASNLVGEEGYGFNIALEALNGGRVNIAACSLGGANRCFELARDYMKERKQFGRAISEFQALQFQMAEAFTQLEAARLMTYKAACSLDEDDIQKRTYCAMAKSYASEIGFNISSVAMQMFGGYGYLMDYPIERYFRDLRVHAILEGTNEIMKLMIARDIFR